MHSFMGASIFLICKMHLQHIVYCVSENSALKGSSSTIYCSKLLLYCKLSLKCARVIFLLYCIFDRARIFWT